jgi:hypothetical protein
VFCPIVLKPYFSEGSIAAPLTAEACTLYIIMRRAVVQQLHDVFQAEAHP